MQINKQTFYNIYLPILLFFVAFCSKLFFITDRDICLDEPFTIYHAQFNILDILKLPTQNDPHPPFFTILIHFWIKIFGISPYSVRILPLFFNAFTVIFIYLIGKKTFNIASGVLASGLFILSTLHFYLGLETRTYSLLSLATAASLYFFLLLINNYENKKILFALILTNLVLVYSHYFGWFIVFVQFILSFMYLANKKIFRTLFVSTLFTGILYLPMMPVLIKQFFISSKGTWFHPPSNFDYLGQFWWLLNSKLMFNFIILVLILGIIYFLILKSPKKISRELITLFLWWFIPITIMLLISAKMPIFNNKYISFNTIGLYIFIAVTINILYKKKYAYVIGGLMLILMFSQLQINSKDFYYREVKNAVNKVKSNINTNSIVLIYPYWSDLGFMYYFNRDIYHDFKDYDSLLLKNKIIRVWNIQDGIENIKKYKSNRIVYYQDGQIGDNTIYNYLDSTYNRTDSTFYPQCINIGIFEKK
jgi:mannosyltransferase